MPVKTLYLYSVQIFNTESQTYVTNDSKELFDRIIDKNALNNNGILTISFKDSRKNDLAMDVLKRETEFIFFRMGKTKNTHGYITRDTNNLKYSEVIKEEEALNKRLEACSYFLYDYEKRILCLLSFNQGSPNAGCLTDFISGCAEQYQAVVLPIMMPESVKKLMKSGSTISQIQCEFALPDVKALRHVGFTEEQIFALSESDACKVDIIIKSEPRTSLTNNHNTIQGIINSIKGTIVEKNTLIVGKEPKTRQNKYSFNNANLTYTIDVRTSKTVNKVEQVRSLNEVEEDIYLDMRNTYLNDQANVLMLCYRE